MRLRAVVFLMPLLVLARPAVAQPASRARQLAPAMVVIGPERFHKDLEHYLEYRAKERPTEWVSLESILNSSSGVDDPEKLKRWLYEAWKHRHVRFVLLVGDADLVPVRYMVLDRVTPAAFDYAFYPSDLYYADVARHNGSFDDWNGRKDGFHADYFGEVRGEKNKSDPINFDNIDYRAELAVGRWPVDTEEEVRRVAQKTIVADREAHSGKRPGLRRAAFVWVPGWVDERARMRHWASELPARWKASLLLGGTKTSAVDDRHITALLNEGASLILHVGHGEDNGWAGSFHVGALKHVQNADRLPIVLSAGCSTARFATLPPYEAYMDRSGDKHAGTNQGEVFGAPPPPPSPYARGHYNQTGLGELMVRQQSGGAAAYIGCNTGGQPCGVTLLEGFVLGLHKLKEPTLGDCWMNAIEHYYDAEHLATIKPTSDWYPASIFFQGMKYMVFGDPALKLPAPGQ
jgi:hypothetical protein